MSENNQAPAVLDPAFVKAAKEAEEGKEPKEELEKDAVELLIESIEAGTCYDTARWNKPITIKDKGVDLKCVIWELSSEEREDYMNFQAQKAKYGANGQVTGLKDLKGLQTKLVHMGLIGPDGNKVPEVVIKGWGAGLVKKLADVISRVSCLDNHAESRAKNS